MKRRPAALEVWLDCELWPASRVGTLFHDRGQVRFQYDPQWLRTEHAFALDPDLSLDAQAFFPNSEQGNFGIFLDSSPDRWGQTLMKRREGLQARDEDRAPRTLYAWDYLIGVQDYARQGALRFRLEGSDPFLAAERLAAPPVTNLGELEAVAIELTDKRIDDLEALRQWLAVLVAPGASLGGARPKASFTESDGTAWIGKFPSRGDDRDIGGWEYVVHQLAERAGVSVPPARVVRLNNDFHTFCVQRFDRAQGKRRFYASAMTMLRKDQSEGTSYLELAEFLRRNGDPNHVTRDLEQLYRRVAFFVAVGNRDDHLRNHGFLLTERGWRLSPAFDINPIIDKDEHVLCIDDSSRRPDLGAVLSTLDYYGLTGQRGEAIVDEVVRIVSDWRQEASRLGISRADQLVMAGAFLRSEHD